MNVQFDVIQANAEARICTLQRDASLAHAVKRTWALTKLIPRRTWQFELLGELVPRLPR